jgi:hypothetical protein
VSGGREVFDAQSALATSRQKPSDVGGGTSCADQHKSLVNTDDSHEPDPPLCGEGSGEGLFVLILLE